MNDEMFRLALIDITNDDLLNDFINDNIILRNKKILIIHGKGKGLVRSSVHETLSKRKEVSRYYTDGLNDGCTIVHLNIDN